MSINQVANLITYIWAFVFFLISVRFLAQAEKLRKKLIEFALINIPEYKRDCFSVNWYQDQGRNKIMGENKIILIVIALVPFSLAALIFQSLSFLGYAVFLIPLGLIIFLDTSAFEYYSYSKAVIRQSMEKLQTCDLGFIEEAKRSLLGRTVLYILVGASLVLVAYSNLIQSFFNNLPVIAVIIIPIEWAGKNLGPIGSYLGFLGFYALPIAAAIALVDYFLKKNAE